MIKHVLLPLSLLAASSLALRGAQHADDPHVSRITLAKGADLEAAVRAVHAAGPSVVVADTSGVDAHGRLEQPLDAHVYPERGIMVLSGPLGPGNHPLLRIRVRDASGRTTGWGWFVGTAELSP